MADETEALLTSHLEGVFHLESSACEYATTLALEFQLATWIRPVSNGWEVWASEVSRPGFVGGAS